MWLAIEIVIGSCGQKDESTLRLHPFANMSVVIYSHKE
jgi:hypothetical protein